jgi:Zn-finger nucleic acid-binding protein
VLRVVLLQDTRLLECGSCDGVWIDAPEFERICTNSETQAAVLHRFVGRARAASDTHIRYRPCARCGKMMNRVNFGRLSGTIVDVCRGHGTFLDAGELHQIVAFIKAGGLERARERRMEELKEEQRRLEQLEMRAARDHRAADAHDSAVTWDRGALQSLIDAITGRS